MESPVDRLQLGGHGEQRRDGEQPDRHAEFGESVRRKHRRETTFDHVGEHRSVDLRDDLCELVLDSGLNKDDVGTGGRVCLAPCDCLVDAQ